MAPRPEVKAMERETQHFDEPLPGDEVVISGLSGKFPESDSVRDFMDNLYNKVDMVTGDDRRWTVDHPEIPNLNGKINGMDKFDAQFFGVHYKQAWTMDPMGRMMLENAYQAIIDAGINPRELRHTNTAVYIGISTSDAEKTWYYEKTQVNGFGLTGTARSMLSNRISYWLGCTGPSYTLNSACSSTLQVLEHAYNAIRSGQCDAAVVGGANFCTHPYISLQYSRMGVMSEDGLTRSFDNNASGFGRGEAVSIIFLQKAKDAKRVYAQVVHAKSNCDGFSSSELTTYANKETQRTFLEQFYSEINVHPTQVQYIEAFGIGLPEVDKNELDAIDEVFCKGRKGPIMVGCVKTNMGHSEAASGAAATTKLCLAYHRGMIAPNLHYTEPRDDVEGVREGRVRVVTEPTPFAGGYTAASSYSFSGVNVHVLFKDFAKKKASNNLSETDLPRLVTASGRSEASLKEIFNDLESRPLDLEQVRLLQNIHEKPIPGHVFRSFNVLKSQDGKAVSLSQNVDYFPGIKRSVWFVYSGMGSQWSSMGAHLMRLPVFAAAIERCCQALAPKGVDLMHILTDPNPNMYDNILHSFVGIAAVQIGLTDILTALGIQPDNIIGHSVGELGCAYADGCFTAEEMILAAYSRGLVSVQTPFIRGSMAAVGLGYEEIKTMCPPEIEVACHNGPGSSTISGPADAMKTFVSELTAKGVFAKEVPCSNIAYHSRYIAEAGPSLLKLLREVIKDPKPRSSRWLSTSVPQKQWDLPSAKYSSAEYHTNNLLNPVLFEETARQIPPNAITIEVAPHGLLQAILRRSLAADTVNVPLTKRAHRDNVEFLLNAVGKLFMAGLDLKIGNIYPNVEFPVSAETPMLSHLVSWEHSEGWHNHLYYPKMRAKSGERHFIMSICDEENRFMSGCYINGINVFPAAGYLVLAWETLAMMLGVPYTSLSVKFENIRFESDARIQEDATLELVVMVQKATGNFEVTVEDGVVASGRIYAVKSSKLTLQALDEPMAEDDAAERQSLLEDDIYRIMLSKGYSYKDAFRSIESSNLGVTKAKIKYDNNWVTFLDGIIQMNILKSQSRNISKPKLIENLQINSKFHRNIITSSTGLPLSLDATIYDVYDCTRCGGVELKGLIVTEIPPYVPQGTILETYNFVRYIETEIVEGNNGLRTQVQHLLQNTKVDNLKIVEVVDETTMRASVGELLKNILNGVGIKNEVTTVQELNKNLDIFLKSTEELLKSDLVVFSNLLNRKTVMQKLQKCIKSDCFVLSRETLLPKETVSCEKFNIVALTRSASESLVLMKKREVGGDVRGTKYITVKSNSKFPWVELVQAEWRACDRLVLVSECDPCAGLLGMFNCLRREPRGHVLSLLLISDYSAPAFRPDLPFYQDQLSKGLALNIYQNGKWGSYQHLPLPPVSVQSEHVYLASQRPEDMSSLSWRAGPLTLASKPGNSSTRPVQVYYSAVTLRDVHHASGRVRFENYEDLDKSSGYGMDFCGRTTAGERVMGLLPGGALSSLVEADLDLLWPVPSHWSMEDAVTVPLAYANAFYCLETQATLEAGAPVLIHSGAGALGQAAINICLARGCEVFTTVSSLRKKEWLLKMFPKLREDHVGNSRSQDFEDMVMSGTSEGCSLVLNTLSGELRKVSMRCVAPMGTFVNVNNNDALINCPFGMSFLALSRTYMPASISNLFRPTEVSLRRKIQLQISEGIDKGSVQPLNRFVYGMSETRRAFRFMSTGRHVGKVVLKIRDEELRPLVTPSHALFTAQPHFICSSDASYVVVAGSMYSGLQIADWLVQRGAKNIMLHSKESNGYVAASIRSWRLRGVKIHCSSENLETDIGCMQMLSDSNKQAPVLGVFVASRTVQRGLFEVTAPEDFAKDYADAALVVMNLDTATRKLCPNLKQFVVTSSSAAGHGSAGCSSSSLASSVMERICEQRRKLALPALALQWDVTDEVTNTSPDLAKNVDIEANRRSVLVALNSLDQLLECKHSVVESRPNQSATITAARKPLLSAIAEIIGIDSLDRINDEYTLEKISVDISMAKEIQVLLERDYQILRTPAKILKLTVSELKAMQTKLSEVPKECVESLSSFFNYIDPEEFNAGDALVRMPTLLSDGFETEEEMFTKDTYLILIPGMEGHKNIFSSISKRLKLNAFTCQLEVDNFSDSIQDIASKMTRIIVKKLRLEQTFYLLGYSFGASVALEIASNLEELGYVGKVFCLDGSPEWFAALLDSQLGHLSEQRLQDEVIKHMFSVMSGGGSTAALELSLAAEGEWERKLDACMRHLRGRVQFSFQYQRSLVAMAYARIRQARAYSDSRLRSRPLRSELVLLKATRRPPSTSLSAPPADYGLSRYSQRPLAVYELDCDHAAAPHDLNVSNIINEHIADMDRFKKLNLCDTYLMDYYV